MFARRLARHFNAVKAMYGMSTCTGCGLESASDNQAVAENFNASSACLAVYWDLSAFTLSLRDPYFVHQHVVDAYAAQHSGPNTKPITTAFALIGLYLTFERGYTGREVQKAHMALARVRRHYPRFTPPVDKAGLTVLDALRNVTTDNYEGPINKWAKSVWDRWHEDHEKVALLLSQAGM